MPARLQCLGDNFDRFGRIGVAQGHLRAFAEQFIRGDVIDKTNVHDSSLCR